MKITSILIIVMAVFQVNAQTLIQPFETTINYDNGQRPCLQLNLDPEPKALKHAWRDYLKDNYNFKLKGIGFLRNKDLLNSDEIIVPQISSNAIDFFTHIVEDQNGSEMKVFVRHGYDIYISQENYPNEYAALKEILESFIKFYLPQYYEGKVIETEKRIIKLTDETNDLQKEIADDSSRIVKMKKEITDFEKKLESNIERLEVKNKELIKRTEKLDKIRNQLREL